MPFPVDLKYILETERTLGLEFPESFKNKMMRENGGELMTDEDDWLLFPFLDKSDNKRISRTCNHIVLDRERKKMGQFSEKWNCNCFKWVW
jgi:hypothetical protein